MTEPLTGRVHHLFEAQVVRSPDAPAVIAAGHAISYLALDRAANRLARRLRREGVTMDIPVGICLPRSIGAITAILAVLKAGGVYLPLDPAYPAERLAYMLENSGARLLIADAAGAHQWPAGVTTLEIDAAGDESDPADRDDATADSSDDVLAYLIYTSGSTGRPKGVAMPHAPLLNLLRWQAAACPLPSGSRVLQFAPLSFDVSFQEIFSTLGEGGTLMLITEDLRRDPRGLLHFLGRERVTRVFLPPVMLHQLAGQCAAGGDLPASLREVITAGEALQITPDIAAFFSRLQAAGGGTLHNHYGPTETHVVTSYTLAGRPESWPALPSIGQPIDHVVCRLVDEAGRDCPDGEPGALLLGGACLARGYVRDADLTAAKFVELAGARWYRTGDLACRAPDGNLQFLGRADDQVKIRGFRIELGEIETVLARHPSVQTAAAGVVAAAEGGTQDLVAYIVPREGTSAPVASALRRWLLEQLPAYVVPSHFVILDQLPLTPSGKVDRRALAKVPVPREQIAPVTPAAAPRTTLEKAVAQAWEEILGIRNPGIRDAFFEVGGNSLLAVRVHTKLCQSLQREFPIAAIFQHPTIAALAAYLDAPVGETSAPSIQDRARRQQQQQQAAAAARARLVDYGARRTA